MFRSLHLALLIPTTQPPSHGWTRPSGARRQPRLVSAKPAVKTSIWHRGGGWSGAASGLSGPNSDFEEGEAPRLAHTAQVGENDPRSCKKDVLGLVSCRCDVGDNSASAPSLGSCPRAGDELAISTAIRHAAILVRMPSDHCLLSRSASGRARCRAVRHRKVPHRGGGNQ